MILTRAEEKSAVFAEWASATTAHGFLDFSQAKTVIGKVIWFILIFVSLTLMCYQVQRGVSDYLSHEWKASIQEKRSTEDRGVPFPSVIACNVNRLKYSKVQQYNMTLDMVRYLFMNLVPFSGYLIAAYNTTGEEDFINWRKSHNFTLADIYDAMGQTAHDMFPSDPQHQQTFDTTYTSEYGKCIRVDFNMNSTRVGSKGGNILIFHTEGWDYLPLVENNYILEGIVFQVTYDSAQDGKWLLMHPGTQVAVGIQAVEETVREPDLSIFNPFAFFNTEPPCQRAPQMQFMENCNYSVINCETECMWLISIHLCNCTPFMPTKNYRECDIEEYLRCFGHNKTSFDEQKEYDVQDEALSKWLKENNVKTLSNSGTIVLEIYFNSLETKTIELYEVTTFDSLISNCGGLIGLWAGMSFLTIFQALSYFFKFIEQRCTTSKDSKL